VPIERVLCRAAAKSACLLVVVESELNSVADCACYAHRPLLKPLLDGARPKHGSVVLVIVLGLPRILVLRQQFILLELSQRRC
jgi:hypothetical protein